MLVMRKVGKYKLAVTLRGSVYLIQTENVNFDDLWCNDCLRYEYCALVSWLEQVLLALISTDKVNLLVYTLGETF